MSNRHDYWTYIYICCNTNLSCFALALLNLAEGCAKPSFPIGDDPNLCIHIYIICTHIYIYRLRQTLIDGWLHPK